MKTFTRLAAFFLFFLSLCGTAWGQSVAPFQGVGNVQFLDNSGAILTNGVLYVYQAGTTTQVASYTDASGTIQNPNPVPFSTGARASIWLTVGSLYHLVLCLQNDGAFCAPADVLYSVDNIPVGSSSGGGGGGGTFTGIFISGSATPATSGALRLATADGVCWRNQANTTNLCFTKNSNDLFSIPSGFILPTISSIAGSCVSASGFSCLWADNTSNRWTMTNNGGAPTQIVAAGVDIDNNDRVVQLHFAGMAAPLSSTPLAVGQALTWNGTSIAGGNQPQLVYTTATTPTTAPLSATTMATAGAAGNLYRFGGYLTITQIGIGCSGSPLIAVNLIWTDPSGSSPVMALTYNVLFAGNGTLGVANTNTGSNSEGFNVRAKATTVVQFSTTVTATCTTNPQYQFFPTLEQMTAN